MSGNTRSTYSVSAAEAVRPVKGEAAGRTRRKVLVIVGRRPGTLTDLVGAAEVVVGQVVIRAGIPGADTCGEGLRFVSHYRSPIGSPLPPVVPGTAGAVLPPGAGVLL